MRKFFLTGVTILALTVLLTASASAITLTFTGGSHQNTAGGYLVGPYSMMLDPDRTLSPNVNGPLPAQFYAGICDDSAGTITSGQTWEVTMHDLTAAGLVGTKYFDPTNATTADASLRNYLAVTYIAEQLLALPTPTSSWTNVISDSYNATRTAYQWAIWTIFNSAPAAPGSITSAVSSTIAAAYSAVDNNSWTGGGWAVFTPTAAYAGRQEMLIRVPEAASLASLGLNFGALALLGFAFRRRMN